MKQNRNKLIIEGNSLYEIDMDCINKKSRGESCYNQEVRQQETDWTDAEWYNYFKDKM